MLRFYLAATQFALGDLPAPTTPSAKLTPAVRARERLAWRLALVPSASDELTLFELAEKAAEHDLLYIGGSNRQQVSHDIPKPLDHQLTADDMRKIRLKLDAAGVRLLTYQVDPEPADQADRNRIVEFATTMGCEAIISKTKDLTIEGAPQIVAIDGIADTRDVTPLSARTPKPQPKPTIFTVQFGTDTRRTGKGWIHDIALVNQTSVFLAGGGRP
jgi:hypothetical protein